MANNLCCDVCQPVCPYTELNIASESLGTRKRRPRMRAVSSDIQSSLETKLLVERDTLISKHPGLKMLPKSVVCPLSVIREVCSRCKSINSIEDIRSLPCIRPEFHLAFFNAVVECTGISNAPPQKRTCTRTRS